MRSVRSSGAIAGVIASAFGATPAFIAIFGIALAGTAGLWLFMPETKPGRDK